MVSSSAHLTATSPHSVASLRAAFADPDYWNRRLEMNDTGAPTLDSLHTDADGTTTVEFTMRFSGDQLPAVLRPLRLGTLTVTQREEWRVDGDGVRGTVVLDALRTPLSGRGTAHLRPDGGRTVLTGAGVVDVAVPLVGRPIARFLAEQLADAIREIVRVTDRWLASRN